MNVFNIFITVPNKKQAKAITSALLEKKLVACVSCLDHLHSRYWWKGSIETSSELLLIAKTVAAHVPEIIKCVKSIHSYTVPEIIAVPIVAGNGDYLDWIKTSVTPFQKKSVTKRH
ncbi:MAG: divalent-cation tolerance protein CutA [Endomicrobiales bacterium]